MIKKIVVALIIPYILFMYSFNIYDDVVEVSKNSSAKVISRENSYILINKGKKYGIEEGDMVSSNGTLIGLVLEVNDNDSLVRLIIDSENKVSVKIIDEEVSYGLVDNYKSSYLIINGIKNKNIKIGSKVYTTGISYIYNPDIYIGEVSKIVDDEDYLVYVKTSVDFDNIWEVNILKK